MACVLIVDDDAGALLTLRIGLQRAGYSVHTAASGEAACDFLGQSAPDALLLDLKLPGISGYEVLAWMRDHAVVVPTAAMTGFLDLFEPADVIAFGAAMCLRKPVSLDEVVEAVSRLTRGGCSESATSDDVGCGRDSPAEDSLRGLHRRMLAGDAAARERLADELLAALRRNLQRAFVRAPDDVVFDAVVDAIMEYIEEPLRFDASRGVPLHRFVQMAARRNLANHVRSEAQRKAREAAYGLHAIAIREAHPSGDDDLRSVVLDLARNERERRVLSHLLDGNTRGLQQALEVLDPDPDNPARKIKRFTDRMRRRFARLRHFFNG
jgi:DNA-binding response OmpR family regulator